MLQGFIRHENKEDKKKHGPGRPVKAPQFSSKVAKSLRRDEQLVKSIRSDFIRTESSDTNVSVSGNLTEKKVWFFQIADMSQVHCKSFFVKDELQERKRSQRIYFTFFCARD